MSVICVKDLGFSYAQKPVLKNISFTLESGQFYALLGPNGAGKSTLFSLLSQLLHTQKGNILIQGADVKTSPRRALAALGIVFQQSTLDLDLSVSQNLHYHGALHGLSRKQTQQRIEYELARLELTEREHDKVRSLNGGHRRRVEIARALLHQPALLLLDEASVGLDIPTRNSINAHIRALCDSDGVTVLSSTHLIDEIQPGDHLMLLHQGALKLDMPCSEALAQYDKCDVSALYQAFTQREQAA